MDENDEFMMNLEENRVATFKDWPFDNENCACISKNMAKAGFFHTPTDKEPDLVKCFCCLKELDGWDPEDDPWKEHKRHSPKCAFIKLNKEENQMKIEDFLKIECERQKARVEYICRAKIEKFREEADKVRTCIEQM